MKPKNSKPNITKIANLAGVSIATVSRVINKNANVSPETHQKIFESMRALNYVPKIQVGKKRIGIIIEGNGEIKLGPYEDVLIKALSQYAFEAGFELEIIPCQHLEVIRDNFLQVAIAIVYNKESEHYLMENCNIPLITINTLLPGITGICSDHRQSSELAVNYLVQKGHRRIAFIGTSCGSWGSSERLAGYRAALAANQQPFDPQLLQLGDSDCVEMYVDNVVRSGADALIAAGEGLGLRINYALYRSGKSIPDDISVISFESPAVSPYLIPAHTTVSQNFDILAAKAMKHAEAVLNGIPLQSTVHELFPNSLIERNSVSQRKYPYTTHGE